MTLIPKIFFYHILLFMNTTAFFQGSGRIISNTPPLRYTNNLSTDILKSFLLINFYEKPLAVGISQQVGISWVL